MMLGRFDDADDDGAFAVLYAVLVVVLIGITALVVDLGILRMDRRADRAAVDAGALAGSAKLGLGGEDPVAACQTAMQYVAATFGVALDMSAGVDPCSKSLPTGFAGDASVQCEAGTPLTVTRSVGERTIAVSWPVPDDSLYLTQPDMEQRGQPNSQFVTNRDGDSCTRLAVRIQHTRQAIFSVVWPDLGNTRQTESRSVALSSIDAGNGELPAPLVVLERRQCKSMDVTGGGAGDGGVVIRQSATPSVDGSFSPGYIQVDSAATAVAGENGFGGSCQTAGSAPINVPTSKVWVLDGLDKNGKFMPGIVGSYAEATGKSGYSSQTDVLACPPVTSAFDPPPSSTLPTLCRITTPGPRIGAGPWVVRYNCGGTETFSYKGGCPQPEAPRRSYPPARNYVDQWRNFATAALPSVFDDSILSSGKGKGKGASKGCSDASGAFGSFYTNCANLNITGNMSVSGKFVATGDVTIASSGCLLLNTTLVAGCDALPATITSPAPSDGANAYIGGKFDVGGGFVARQTFLYLTGRLSVNTSRVVSWVGPYGADTTGSPLCQPATTAGSAPSPACFEDLTMWSPYIADSTGTSRNVLTGNANLQVDGTLFMPEAFFTFNGQADNQQTKAQFVARSLNVTGGGLLTMTPDASRSTPIPPSSGRLIR